MIKASAVSQYENSQSKAKDVVPSEELNKESSGDKIKNVELEEKYVDVGSPSEKLKKMGLPDIRSERKSERKPWRPMSLLSNESLLLAEPDVEVKETTEEYTGFTIAFKDKSVASLRLKRQDSLRTLKAVLDVPKKAEDEKREDSRELIEVLSHARVGHIVELPTNPYSKPEEIWTGLEVNVVKKDQSKTYVLMTQGLAKWVIDEQQAGLCTLASTESTLNYWEVDTAEVVREKGKGPYVKLNIDKDRSVCLKPKKATDGQLKRFMTGNF